MSPQYPGSPSLRASAVFARWRASASDGSIVPWHAILARHSELRADLELLHAGWLKAEGLLCGLAIDEDALHSVLRSLARDPLSADPGTIAWVERLSRLRPAEPRYLVEKELGRGGMGVVLQVEDRTLDRTLAMKVLHPRQPRAGDVTQGLRSSTAPQGHYGPKRSSAVAFPPSDGGPPSHAGADSTEATDPTTHPHLRRFLAEARVLSRLEHPSIPPIHDLGVAEDGGVFFTMPVIDGPRLADVFRSSRRGDHEWPRARALEALLKVCEAIDYAHEHGVVHRDLKPQNVMVGRFGEVYVLDWGLARVEREQEAPNGSEGEAGETRTSVDTDPAGDDLAASIHTLDGSVLGTPNYMSPEQARGEIAAVGPRSDVYSMGAMLYEFLAGSRPYGESASESSKRAILDAVVSGPPLDVLALDVDADEELVAICRQAMARDPSARYPDARTLASDLRAYLEGRVVTAHERGAWPELRKWITRNRGLSASIVAALSATILGLALFVFVEQRRTRDALRFTQEVRLESALRTPAALRETEQDLWPALPHKIPELEAWLAIAHALVDDRSEYASTLAELRARGQPAAAGSVEDLAVRSRIQSRISVLRGELLGHVNDIEDMLRNATGAGREQGIAFTWRALLPLERRLEVFSARMRGTLAWSFTDPVDKTSHDALERLIEDIDDLDVGLISSVEQRLAEARDVERSTISDLREMWERAVRSIADPRECPHYRGLVLTPQIGLVPLGRDPASGMWEFAHVATGAVPSRGKDGRLTLVADMGVVLVLIPSGTFEMGPTIDEELRAWNPGAYSRALAAGPATTVVELDAFFLSKYELTQAQWIKVTQSNPAYFSVGSDWDTGLPAARTVTSLFPMDSVNWFMSVEALAKVALELPTDAQAEYSIRAGSKGAWTSPGPGCPEQSANLRYALPGEEGLFATEMPERVGSRRANDWGLHDTIGNVGEWTSDPFWVTVRYPRRSGDGKQYDPREGEGVVPDSGLRVIRGHGFEFTFNEAMSYARWEQKPVFGRSNLGVRPMRRIDR